MLIAALIITCSLKTCSKVTTVEMASGTKSSAPWQLDVTDASTIEIRNTSGKSQLILPDSKIQPSRLRLFAADGQEVMPVDARARMKFNNTLQKSSYIAIEPGGRVPFSRLDVEVDAADSLITHGPFRFSIKAGATYTGRIEWHSERNDYLDETGTRQKLAEVWLGNVTSKTFKIVLDSSK